MRRIDELHMEFLSAEARMRARPLRRDTDHGSQGAFIETVLGRRVRLSTDGTSAWRANVFVELVWRNIKYEEAYVKAYESVSHARRSISDYIELYNRKRPRSNVANRKADEAYFATLPAINPAT